MASTSNPLKINEELQIEILCNQYENLLSIYENEKATLSSEPGLNKEYVSAMRLITQMSTTLLLAQRKLCSNIRSCQERINSINKCLSIPKPTRDYVNTPKNQVTCKLFDGCTENSSYYFRTPLSAHKLRNDDYLSISQSGYQFLRRYPHSKRWTDKQKNILYEGVRSYLIQHKSTSLLQRFNEIFEEISSTTSETVLDKLRDESERVMSEWENAKDLSLKTLVQQNPHHENYDWKMICRKMVNYHSAEDCKRTWSLVANVLLNNQPWSTKEDLYLQGLVVKNKFQRWSYICSRLGTNRSEFNCFVRFQSYLKRRVQRRKCTRQSDTYAEACQLRTGTINTLVSCRKRANISKGIRCKFSNRENFIIDYYRQRGYSYHTIARKLGKRTPKQVYDRCREMNRPRRLRSKWSTEEVRLLLTTVKYCGENWTEVSKMVKSKGPVLCKQKYQQFQSENKELTQRLLHTESSIKECNKLLNASARVQAGQHDVDKKLEMYFLEELQKDTTSVRADKEEVTKGVLRLLRELNFNIEPADSFIPAITEWLFNFQNNDVSCENEFDSLFAKFYKPSKRVFYMRNGGFSNIVPKCRVLPPNKCTMYGLHTLMKSYKEHCATRNLNFQSIWADINAKYGRDKDFTATKIMWYRVLRMIFYWPIKLGMIPPEEVIEK